MRVKIRDHAAAVELLELACNCKILLTDGGYIYERQMANPKRASMIYTTSAPRRSARAAARAALGDFGRELRAILTLKPRIHVERSARSVTQSTVSVYFDGNLVERFDNSAPLHSGSPLDTRPWKSERYPLEHWRTIGAGYVLRFARKLLPACDQDLIDPIAEAIRGMSQQKCT